MSKNPLPKVINQDPHIAAQRLHEEYLAYLEELRKIQDQSFELVEAFKRRSRKPQDTRSNLL
ncbi:hypothetical protein KAZ92_02560 [Candidatus Gracilibacteria bacterium]|nr:hypothetical protein [Candidatus Gracilibacteria bacterium]